MPLEEKGKAEIVIVTHRASLADYDYILHTLQGYEEIDCLKANYRIEGCKVVSPLIKNLLSGLLNRFFLFKMCVPT